MADWFGSGAASPRQVAERIIAETIRRVKLAAKNDPTFVPQADDASLILSARHFVVTPVIQFPGPDDANALIANRVYQHGAFGQQGGGAAVSVDNASMILAAKVFLHGGSSGQGGHRLTFGTHLTGTSYDGSADVTLSTDAVSTNTVSTIVARDVNGDFAARIITASLIGNVTGNVSGSSGSTTGNAATATALQTGRAINGVTFDGTSPITVPAAAGTLTGGTLAAGVTASSLTSLGTQAIDVTIAAGQGLSVGSSGGAARVGETTLVGGTKTVNTTSALTGVLIFLSRRVSGGTVGTLTYTIASGTSFTINSSSGTDTSTVAWMIVTPF